MDLINNKLKVVIVDDEKHGRELLKKLISLISDDFMIIGEADSVESGIEKIEGTSPDLVFLDIALADRTAFEILEHFHEIKFSVVFATAYNYYAIKAIKFSALDYLVKPIDPEELKNTLDKAKARHKNTENLNGRINLAQSLSKKQKPDKIALPTNMGYNFIDLNEIMFCSAENNYTKFHLVNKSSFLTCHTLGEYEELLGDNDFFRIHNSFLINMHHVQSYIKGKGGFVLMKDGTQIEVSIRKKDQFLKHFTKL